MRRPAQARPAGNVAGRVVIRPLAIAWLLCTCAGAPAAARELSVGAAAVPLEGDDSMDIAGGIGPGKAAGQEGELRATAVVVEKPPARLAIVTCDVLFVPGDLVGRALERVERETRIPPAHVLVTATRPAYPTAVRERPVLAEC